MAKCKCGVEMLDGEACKITKVALSNGKTFKRIPSDDVCGDCAVKEGQIHHMDCDMEQCPVCHGQLLSCGCPLIEWRE